jgi:hypothetical protein
VARTEKRRALVWKQSRDPNRDDHKHYQAKTAAGGYSVAAEYQPGKGFIGYRVTQSVADKWRVIATSMTRLRSAITNKATQTSARVRHCSR